MASPRVLAIAERLDLPADRVAFLDSYDDADLAVLDDALRVAIRAEDEVVDKGLAEALRFVPRPLRGRARTMLFGSERG